MLILPGQAEATWFARLGLPLTKSDLHDARAYLTALRYPHAVSTRAVAGWDEASAVTRDPTWDQDWWAQEDAERERLMTLAERRLGRLALLEHLTAATELVSQAIHGAAAIAAEREGVADAALVRAAAGAAMMSLHAVTLARIAEQGPDHLFMRKYALFESGRWPLGVVGAVFYLF